MPLSKYRRRREDKYLRQCAQLAKMRAAKAHKRMENPLEREPKLVRFFPLEFCVRNKLTGETSAWHDLRSARYVAKAVTLIIRYCSFSNRPEPPSAACRPERSSSPRATCPTLRQPAASVRCERH